MLAQVAGTEHYRTELTGHGKKFDGECSCPASDDWGVCNEKKFDQLADGGGNPAYEEAAGLIGRMADLQA